MEARSRLRELCARDGLDSTTRILLVLKSSVTYPDAALVRSAGEFALAAGIQAPTVREVCLQAISYVGFPRALAALEALASILPPPGPAEPAHDERATWQRGWAHFGRVYGRHRDTLFARLADLDRTFAEQTVRFAYGTLLSRPAIDGKTRELMGVVSLSVLGQVRQLVAHAWGARHFGATKREILEAVRTPAFLFEDVAGRGHAARIVHEFGEEF